MRRPVTAAALALAAAALLAAASPARAEHPAIERADRAADAGRVEPERDLAPLLEALAVSRFAEERRRMIGIVVDLGRADAQTSNAIKSWLLEHATPVLLEVARTGDDAFLQGDALYALREMRAPRAVLEQAAAIAEADPDDFVRSRGEILRNWIAGLPPEEEAAGRVAAADPGREAAAIAYLDKRGIAISTQALRDAAMEVTDEESILIVLHGIYHSVL